MLRTRSLPLLLFGVSSLLVAQSAVTGSHEREHAATAVMLARTSAAHASSGDEDIYLADLKLGGKQEPELAKLVDQYPSYMMGIDKAALKAHRRLRVRVTRDPECDEPASEIFLPKSQADDFDPEVRQTLHDRNNEIVPCYRLEHGNVRLGR